MRRITSALWSIPWIEPGDYKKREGFPLKYRVGLLQSSRKNRCHRMHERWKHTLSAGLLYTG